MFRVACATVATCLVVAIPARAQIVLTLDDTIVRARERAGPVAVARARVAEAEAAVVDASARFRENPVLETSAGPRSSAGTRGTDLDVTLSQQFETGGQRQARLLGARATVDRARADADVAARRAVFDAASAFLAGVAAGERLRLAADAERVSRELLVTTERRYAAGDIAAIDLNLARIDAARSAGAHAAARLNLTTAIDTLRALLRLAATEPIELRGSLDPTPLPALRDLEASIEQRPEFSALAADAREADARMQLGRALISPDVGVRVGYAREASDTILLGGLTITLPAFQRGRGALAAGLAGATRARLELDTAREFAIAELRAAYTAYEQRTALAQTFSAGALPSLSDNEALSRRSYEAGEMNLIDFLLIRRDAFETHALIIDRRLESARSRLEVDFIAGVLR